jgi:uncharacterized membrane protein
VRLLVWLLLSLLLSLLGLMLQQLREQAYRCLLLLLLFFGVLLLLLVVRPRHVHAHSLCLASIDPTLQWGLVFRVWGLEIGV